MAAARDTHERFATKTNRREEYGHGADARELTEFFQSYESKVGLRSLHFDSIYDIGVIRSKKGGDDRDVDRGDTQGDSRERFSTSPHMGPPSGWDRYAEIVPALTEGKRVYRNLKALDDAGGSKHVIVLWRLYGARNPATEFAAFKEFGSLAAYTDAVSDARDALAFIESEGREEGVRDRVEAVLPRERVRIEREIEWEFWNQAQTIVNMTKRHASIEKRALSKSARLATLATEPNPRAGTWATKARAYIAAAPVELRTLSERIRGAEAFQARLLQSFFDNRNAEEDGSLRARLGAITSADRETTVADAIRWMLRDASKGMSAEAKSERVDERLRFVSTVCVQANNLRKDAHSAYSFVKRGR